MVELTVAQTVDWWAVTRVQLWVALSVDQSVPYLVVPKVLNSADEMVGQTELSWADLLVEWWAGWWVSLLVEQSADVKVDCWAELKAALMVERSAETTVAQMVV